MKIGIGITTYNRPECLKKCLEQINLTTDLLKVTIYVATDTNQDRKGVAFRKNECLRSLKDCDYIFLFDDDCYPIIKGWAQYFIGIGKEHLLFMDDKLHRMKSFNNIVRTYYDCGGVFLFITKQALERVGAMNEDFKIWGFEHAEWSNRITGKRDHYEMANHTEVFLCAEDYGKTPIQSSITQEEKNKLYSENRSVYLKPIEIIYRPL